MKAQLVLAAAAISLFGAHAVLADNPYLPQCALSYHSDSYGRGIEAVILGGGDLRPKLSDEGCYLLGSDYARQSMHQNGDDAWECKNAFNDGHREGLDASAESSGTICYGLGYQAGRADLDIGAREGDVSVAGQDCVDAYQSGVRDFKHGRAATSPDFEAKIASCYSLGYFDGPLN